MRTVYIPNFTPPIPMKLDKSGTKSIGAIPGKSKYHNKKVVIDEIKFDSMAEGNRYCELRTLKRCGAIKSFGMQPSFVLPGGIRYRADFIVCDGKNTWVEDVKGKETTDFRLKQKLWNEYYSGIELRVLKI